MRQAGLAARGAEVVRLNTYSTLPVAALPADALAAARGAEVVAFASPSAVKAWVALAGDGARGAAAACIGAPRPAAGPPAARGAAVAVADALALACMMMPAQGGPGLQAVSVCAGGWRSLNRVLCVWQHPAGMSAWCLMS